jgi:GAF domain-containing protein
MEWYRIHSLQHGSVDVQAANWLSALGAGLGKMGVVQDLTRIACETLPNGHILVRDVKTGAGYAVVAIEAEHAIEDEPTSESDLAPIPTEYVQTKIGVDEYAREILGAFDAQQAIERALGALRELAPAEAGSVLRRYTDDWLVFEGTFGPHSERLNAVAIPPDTGVAGFCVARGIAVSVKDAYSDPRFFKQMDAYTGFHTHSLLCLPLTIEGTVYGCVELLNAANGAFTRDQIGDADLIANVLSTRLAAEPVPSPPSASRA